MIKKIIFYMFLFILMIPNLVFAGVGSLVEVNGKYYDSLEEAIKNASSNSTIKLISDVVLKDGLNINKTVNINLNGNNITAPEMVFKVQGGVLNVSGNGIIRETKPNYAAIAVIGSNDSNDKDYSVVNVDEAVKLEGWSGILITHDNSKSYGVLVNLDGDINAVNDISGGTGIGVYVNGNIKHNDNVPIVNIGDKAEITSTGNGIYIAGNAIFNIGKAYIEGDESGIGIKAGTLNIDGATILSEGKDNTPTEGYTNGIKASGTAIQIESNSGYAGNMNINIDSGTFRSKNSYVIYEYIGKGTSTEVDNVDLSGGTYRAHGDKPVFGLSDSFKNKHGKFISGGRYTTNPSEYLESGFSSNLEDDLYVVSSSSVLVSGNNVNTDDGNGVIKVIAISIIVGVAIILIYMNRETILGLFRK